MILSHKKLWVRVAGAAPAAALFCTVLFVVANFSTHALAPLVFGYGAAPATRTHSFL